MSPSLVFVGGGQGHGGGGQRGRGAAPWGPAPPSWGPVLGGCGPGPWEPSGTRGVSQPSAALFEACCSDHIQPFDDDEDDDIWEDKETRCAARVVARARCVACASPLNLLKKQRSLWALVRPRPAPAVTPTALTVLLLQVWGPSCLRELPGEQPGPCRPGQEGS